jgi:predicted DNA-binding protein
MSKQISLTLSDDALQRAEILARGGGREVSDVLAEAIELSLNPLGTAAADSRPAREWTDGQVIAAADSTMPDAENERLTELLDRQREGLLSFADRDTLDKLMQMYHAGLLRKATGLQEAVRRGLRQPIDESKP